MSIEIRDRGLYVEGTYLPLISGAIQYWRHEKALWLDILKKVKGMGFRIVEVYVSWANHEIERGKFDFGDKKENLNLHYFLSLCKKEDLYVIIRPGPHINTELTYFGYPKRLFDDPEMLSRSIDENHIILPTPPRMFPVPSYASDKFYKEVEIYFKNLMPILKDHLYPQGSIIAIQADNEMSFFFRTSPYDHDYSDNAKALYHQFLERRYGNISSLNEAYSSDFLSFSDVPMAKEFNAETKTDLPYFLDWVAYKEHYILNALSRISDMHKRQGITGIITTHNYPVAYPSTPLNICKTESEVLDIQGVDIYPTKEQYEMIKKGILYVAGTSRLPYIPEFSSGCFPWWVPITLEDQRFTTLVNLMFGIKGINFYMIVERERWFGSPIARDGRIRREYYDFFKKLNSLIYELNLFSLNRKNEIILLSNRDYTRLENAAYLFSPISPFITEFLNVKSYWMTDERDLGFSDCIQRDYGMLWDTWYKALNQSKYSFLLGDTEMNLEQMKNYKIIFLPTFEYLTSSIQEKLISYVKEGGVLVIGPRLPNLNELMKEEKLFRSSLLEVDLKTDNNIVERMFEAGEGKIVLTKLPGKDEDAYLQNISELIEMLASESIIKRHFLANDNIIETSFHENSNRKVLYIANPSEMHRNPLVEVTQNTNFKDMWTGEEFNGNQVIEVPIDGYTIRILEVRSC